MSAKIDFNDPKTVRHCEERIAEFEGWQFYGGNWYTDKFEIRQDRPPQYHKCLPDLFRVLRKIGFYTVVGDDKEGHDCYIGELRGIGARCFDTPEKAIFTAICQYLEKHAPPPR